MSAYKAYAEDIKTLNNRFEQLVQDENRRHADRLREIAEQETAAINEARSNLTKALTDEAWSS